MIEFRVRHVPDALVASVQASIDRGRVRDEPSRNQLQTTTLLDVLAPTTSTEIVRELLALLTEAARREDRPAAP